ncbi:hypothetical protein BTUL_0164g00220 [Botrytis tulipae]|uniref:Uncharacterized protein n=1 Tax=Botrytis tulipae TaxID=87230 RepID=A0A4Z1EE58_9HELO|nr:hypothetical protein BTUL_0164g00220 [Botrytis tulipae]
MSGTRNETQSVCEINHESYYRNHPQLQDTGTILRNMEHRNIEIDPSNAELDPITKVLAEREAIKKRVEEEKRVEEAAKRGGTSEEIANQ